MQVITGKDDNNIYRLINTDDMTITFLDEESMNYYKDFGVKFETNLEADSWYTLLNILTKHTFIYGDYEYTKSDNELRKISQSLHSISKHFRDFNVPCRVCDVKIIHVGSSYFLVANDCFVYMVSRKVCKLVYIVDSSSYTVRISLASAGECETYSIGVWGATRRTVSTSYGRPSILINDTGKVCRGGY